ncbi:MAG: ABC transporter ATP-binding protein [Bellilinea sp.]
MQISITQLTKDYGKFRALDGISMCIPGGMFALLGPNGAGKTTLMRILTTLLAPSSGQVRIGEFDVMQNPEAVRKHLGYLPQDFGFYRSLTAFEMLDYIGAMKNLPPRQRKEAVLAVLAEVHLLHEARRKVGTFSGGMRQRLGIAQALLGNPMLIVVDEPTAGLDPEERIRFRNLLSRLAQERTILLSTHIVADVEASCTGLAVLNRAKLVFSGTPDQLVDRARGAVWRVDVPAKDWHKLEARYPVLTTQMLNNHIQARLLADHPPLDGAQPVEPDLEDGYMAVIKSTLLDGLRDG